MLIINYACCSAALQKLKLIMVIAACSAFIFCDLYVVIILLLFVQMRIVYCSE